MASEPSMPPPDNGFINKIANKIANNKLTTIGLVFVVIVFIVVMVNISSDEPSPEPSPSPAPSPEPAADPDPVSVSTPCETPSNGSWNIATPTAPSTAPSLSIPTSNVTCSTDYTHNTTISQVTCNADGTISQSDICILTVQPQDSGSGPGSGPDSVNNTCTATDPNASPSTITVNDGATYQFTCLPGYNGAAPMLCNNGNFDYTHSCVPSQCEPSQVLHSNNYNTTGSITGNFASPAITITCEAGYTGGGDVTCQPSGTFSTITCDPATCAPTTIPNASPSTIPTGTYGDPSTIINNCINTHEFHNLPGSITATCGSDGQYTIVGECYLKNCVRSVDPNQVNLTFASPSPNELYCLNGRVTDDPIDITSAINNGCECTQCANHPDTGTSGITWTGTYCDIPPSCPSTQVLNSDHQSPGSITGNIESPPISITCDTGYTGNDNITCEYYTTTSTLSFTDITCTGLPCTESQNPTAPNEINCNGHGTPTGTYSDATPCTCTCSSGYTGPSCDIRYCSKPPGFNWDTTISTPTAPTTGTSYYPLTNVTCDTTTGEVINYNPDSLSYSELMANSSWWGDSRSPGHVTCDPSGVAEVIVKGSSGSRSSANKCVTIDDYFSHNNNSNFQNDYPYYIIDYNTTTIAPAAPTNYSILWNFHDNNDGYCGLPDTSSGTDILSRDSMKPFHCVGFNIGEVAQKEGPSRNGAHKIDYLFPVPWKTPMPGYDPNYDHINKRINISPIIASLYGQERRGGSRNLHVDDNRYSSAGTETDRGGPMPSEINWTGTLETHVPLYSGGHRYEEINSQNDGDSTTTYTGADGRLRWGRIFSNYSGSGGRGTGLPLGTHPVDRDTNLQNSISAGSGVIWGQPAPVTIGGRNYYPYASHCDRGGSHWYDTECYYESALQIWGTSMPSDNTTAGQYTGTNKNVASKHGAHNYVNINRNQGTCVEQKTIDRLGHGTHGNMYTCKWNSMDELYHKISPTQPPAQRFKLTRDDRYITYEYDDLIGL